MSKQNKQQVKVNDEMVENITKQNDGIAREIIDRMSKDGLRWCEEWQHVCAGISGSTGKPYNGRNAFITAYMQDCMGSDDPRWFTRGTLEKNGYVIDDDADPVYIEKWKMMTGHKLVKVKDDDGNERDEWRSFRYMKLVGGWVVYNAADVYGLPEYAKPEFTTVSDDAGALADEFIKTSRCPIYEEKNDSAYYAPATDEIHVPMRKQFASNGAFLRTLLHEMTHSTMKPLKRRQMTKWGDDAYAFEELVAELGSAFTAAATGYQISDEFMDNQLYIDQHAAYIKSWVSHFDNEPDTIFKAAALANAACIYHINRLNGIENECDKPKAA